MDAISSLFKGAAPKQAGGRRRTRHKGGNSGVATNASMVGGIGAGPMASMAGGRRRRRTGKARKHRTRTYKKTRRHSRRK